MAPIEGRLAHWLAGRSLGRLWESCGLVPGIANKVVEQQDLMASWPRSWCEGETSKREDHGMPFDLTAWKMSERDPTVESDPIDVATVVLARASIVTQAPRRRSISFRSIGGHFVLACHHHAAQQDRARRKGRPASWSLVVAVQRGY